MTSTTKLFSVQHCKAGNREQGDKAMNLAVLCGDFRTTCYTLSRKKKTKKKQKTKITSPVAIYFLWLLGNNL